jgi:four helix bundle protein
LSRIAHGPFLAADGLVRVQSYRDLDAWKLGVAFAVRVYHVTKRFPPDERYGLTSQLRRAAVAIPSNVSEGHQQPSRAYRHFVAMALGSLAEAETQLEIARRMRLAPAEELATVTEFAGHVRRVLHGLRRSLIPDP